VSLGILRSSNIDLTRVYFMTMNAKEMLSTVQEYNGFITNQCTTAPRP
jgi:hypothetical protein